MFNIPGPEIHDRVIIISVLFPREAKASSTAGNLLHCQTASPASPIETVPFLSRTCLWILKQEAASGGSKEPAHDSPAPRLVSAISLLQQGGRGALPAPHPHRLGQCETSKLCECTGLARLQPGSATGTVWGAVPAHSGAFPKPCWSGQHQVCCPTRPGAVLAHYSQSPGSFTLSQPLAGLPERQSALHLPSRGSPGSWERMSTQRYTSVLGQHYKSFWLVYTSIGGNKQCLEAIEPKQGLNCWDKHSPVHMNTLLWADNRFLSG